MPVHAFLKGGHAVLMVQKHEKSPFLADVRQPPEGQCDCSPARSAWDIATPKKPSRRVRSDSCKRAHFDSVIEEWEWPSFGGENRRN